MSRAVGAGMHGSLARFGGGGMWTWAFDLGFYESRRWRGDARAVGWLREDFFYQTLAYIEK